MVGGQPEGDESNVQRRREQHRGGVGEEPFPAAHARQHADRREGEELERDQRRRRLLVRPQVYDRRHDEQGGHRVPPLDLAPGADVPFGVAETDREREQACVTHVEVQDAGGQEKATRAGRRGACSQALNQLRLGMQSRPGQQERAGQQGSDRLRPLRSVMGQRQGGADQSQPAQHGESRLVQQRPLEDVSRRRPERGQQEGGGDHDRALPQVRNPCDREAAGRRAQRRPREPRHLFLGAGRREPPVSHRESARSRRQAPPQVIVGAREAESDRDHRGGVDEPAPAGGRDRMRRQCARLAERHIHNCEEPIKRAAPSAGVQGLDPAEPCEREDGARCIGAETNAAHLARGAYADGRHEQGRRDLPTAGADGDAWQLDEDESESCIEEERGLARQGLERGTGEEGDDVCDQRGRGQGRGPRPESTSLTRGRKRQRQHRPQGVAGVLGTPQREVERVEAARDPERDRDIPLLSVRDGDRPARSTYVPERQLGQREQETHHYR